MKKFNELPEDVQAKIKYHLEAFPTAYIYFENGEYHQGLVIKSSYAPDHEYIGTYTDKEIFTPEERILNYVNCFHSYPIQYKGERDYSIFRDVNPNAKYKFDENGNIVSAD